MTMIKSEVPLSFRRRTCPVLKVYPDRTAVGTANDRVDEANALHAVLHLREVEVLFVWRLAVFLFEDGGNDVAVVICKGDGQALGVARRDAGECRGGPVR